MSNVNESVMHGLRWVAVTRLLAQVLTWANTFFVIRLIAPEDFGLAALAGVFANFLSMLNELGFGVTLVKWQTRDEDTLRHVFGALLVVGTVFTLVLILLAPILGVLVHEPKIVPLIRFISIQFLTMSFAVIPQARLSMDMRFKQLGVVDISASLVGAATMLILAIGGAGAWSLVVGTVGVTISRAVVLNLFCYSIRAPRFSFEKLRHLAAFSGLVLLERTLWYWYMQIDSLVVGRSLGAAELGIYAVGRQVTNIPLERAMGIINSVALPAFSLVQADLDRVRKGYLRVLRLGAGYAFPVFWGLAVVAEQLVRLVLGTKWLASVVVIQLLCASMPLRMLNSFTGAAVTAIGRQDVNIKSLLLAIAVIPGCVLVGSHWGVVGVAAAWAIGFPIVYLFNAWLIGGALRLTVLEMFAATWPPAVAAAAMSLSTLGLSMVLQGSASPAVQLSMEVPLGILVYTLTLAALSRSAAEEMWDLVRNLSSRSI